MKNLLILLLLPLSIFAQDSWVNFKVQYDFYAPQEANFFMVEDTVSGDTVMFHQPTVGYEYLDTVININSGNYVVTLTDNFGDGWVSNQPAWFKMSNDCQGAILDYTPLTQAFFTLDTLVNIWPCAPPQPLGPLVPTNIIINLDQFTPETSWDIQDSNGIVYASGSGYGSLAAYSVVDTIVEIPKGSLKFNIYDLYGDGLEGSAWQGADGSYFVKQCNDTLVYGTDPAFGFDTIHCFVSDSCPPILGCTDDDYLEYDYYADIDDGSCLTLKVYGCTDISMYNFDALANTMDMLDECEFTLILHDLIGNGWVGSYLQLFTPDTSYIFTHTSGFTDIYQVTITSPDPISFVFSIDPLAQATTIECGFTLINPDGDTMINIQPPFITPSFVYPLITACGNECVEMVYGCTYTNAINYDSLANTDDVSCYYNPGCTNPVYLEYNANYDQEDGSCSTLVVIGCMDSTAFNYVDTANTELPNSCIAVVEGCMQALAFNYNVNANTSDTCIAIVYGCMSQLALNYDSVANVDDNSCIGIVYGCIDTLAFNFSPMANVDDGGCIPVIYGCINPIMFNFDNSANTNDGTCIPFIYGCTDSTMFNFNPLANADNNTCNPFVYGCTDPSALNFNPSANTEDFNCVTYMYGCMDATAFNYDTLANTDNGSCVAIVEGCVDQTAFNYNSSVNVVDSLSCLYSANCITGDSIPYWLNDPCYAWVIDVDDYCCDNEWDDICQLTYDYCNSSWVGNQPESRTISDNINLYPNPTTGVVNFSVNVDISVFNTLGEELIHEINVKSIDLSSFSKGIYHFAIKYQNKFVNYNIVKN